MSLLSESAHVRRELDFQGEVRRGARGAPVRRVQEWLTYHGIATAVDGQFGSATERCVAQFQAARNLSPSAVVDEATWTGLVRPLADVIVAPAPDGGEGLSTYLLRCAQYHLQYHPIEVGGDNRGPWVRLYMNGNEGPSWYWCAGFVTFVLRQACEGLGMGMPIAGSFSCDLLAAQAQASDRFVRGTSVARDEPGWDEMGATQIFLVRRASSDWTHTGISFEGQSEIFSTIEGNTNDEGSRNGYEVCRRTRSIPSKDFIRLTG
jgi:Putative peptidoglycan binding domain